MFDLIGIGALNLDCIASKSRLLSLTPRIAGELSNKFESNTEGQPVKRRLISHSLRCEALHLSLHTGGKGFPEKRTMRRGIIASFGAHAFKSIVIQI